MIYTTINENQKVNYQHFMPFDERNGLGKTEAELQKEGHLTSKPIPDPDPAQMVGKVPTLHYNPAQDEFYYTYAPAPLDPRDERIAQLEKATLELYETMASAGGGTV